MDIYLYVGLILLSICLTVSFPKDNTCYVSEFQPPTNIASQDLQILKKEFESNNIVLINNVFENTYFQTLREGILNSLNDTVMKRNKTFEGLRKAITVKASNLEKNVIVKELYYSSAFMNIIKGITNMHLENVSCKDEASMNLLVYNRPNDFISWHRDPNHYVGRRLTVLLSLVNENNLTKELSMSELQYMQNGESKSIKMPPNSMLIFDGSKINHRATSIGKGDTRIVLSFTYCDVCKESIYGRFLKIIKETVLGY